jgi:adenylate kinase family enzyme
MIVWLNGTFGAGKTTTAQELVTQLSELDVSTAEPNTAGYRQPMPPISSDGWFCK